VVPAARSRVALGLMVVALLLAGCADFSDPAAAHGLTRSDLVAEVAAQLGGSASRTYLATYSIAGGETGTIAQGQRPPRAAYHYPGGELLVTAATTTRCSRRTCTVTATGRPPATAFADAHHAGLVNPSAVQELLNAARVDSDMIVEQHDTTVAGRHATCLLLGKVDKAETGSFSTCVTSDGVLGSFAGTLDGTKVDVALTNYSDTVAGDPFEAPADARMIVSDGR
jgi:hypothetical protein